MEENKIIDYIILEEEHASSLREKVLEKLKEGYVLLGGSSYGGRSYSSSHTQAMVKYEK